MHTFENVFFVRFSQFYICRIWISNSRISNNFTPLKITLYLLMKRMNTMAIMMRNKIPTHTVTSTIVSMLLLPEALQSGLVTYKINSLSTQGIRISNNMLKYHLPILDVLHILRGLNFFSVVYNWKSGCRSGLKFSSYTERNVQRSP